MMIDWVPWLLIVIGWTAEAPDERQVITIEVAVDKEECEAMRRDYVEAENDTVAEDGNAFEFFCTPVPNRGTFNAALERWKNQLPTRPQPE